VEIEGFIPQDFSSLEEATSLIVIAIRTAEDVITRNPNRKAQEAMDEEREAFVDFIQTLSKEELGNIEPLPYRRVLRKSESQQIWAALKKAWNIQYDYWYPLSDCSVSNVSAFQDKYFQEEVGPETLQTLLAKHGITRVWELRQYGPEYELELTELYPYEDEGYWCSEEMDWIIYASHESSVTIGGWLLGEVKKVWPNWEERIWKPPFG
jgi:hypothetical protein